MSVEQRILLTMAAQSFEQAANFAKAGLPADARMWAARGQEQLDQADAARGDARPTTGNSNQEQGLIEV